MIDLGGAVRRGQGHVMKGTVGIFIQHQLRQKPDYCLAENSFAPGRLEYPDEQGNKNHD